MNRSIDQIVKDKLSGFEKEPPQYVWSAINSRILENNRRKRILVLWQSAAAVALLVLSLGIVYLMSGSDISEPQIAGSDETVVKEQFVTGNIQEKQIAQISDVSTENKNATTNSSVTDSQQEVRIGAENKAVSAQKYNNTDSDDGSGNKVLIAEAGYVDIKSTQNRKAAGREDIKSAQDLMSLHLSKDYSGAVEIDSTSLAVSSGAVEKNSKTYYAFNDNLPVYKPDVRKHKFIITGNVSPTYNYRNLGQPQSSVVTVSDNGALNESGIVSVSGGINVRMESKKSRWSFETGILYSQVGQEVSQTKVYPSIAGVASLTAYTSSGNLKNTAVNISQDVESSLGEINFHVKTSMAVEKNFQKSGVYLAAPLETLDQQPVSTTLKQLLDYIEIPLIARYTIFDSKPLITLAGGLSTNFLVDNSAYLIENGEQIDAGTTDGINSVTYSSSVGIGIELPLGKSFRFSLEPRFKYFLSPVNSKGYNNFHPYSFGVFGGISFLLNGH